MKRGEAFEDWRVGLEVSRGIVKMVVILEIEMELVLEMIGKGRW